VTSSDLKKQKSVTSNAPKGGVVDFFREQYFNLSFHAKSVTLNRLDLQDILADDGQGNSVRNPQIRIFNESYP